MSGNPWKAICPFQSLSSTRDEFVEVLSDLKTRASQFAASEDGKPVKGRNKLEQMHLDLVGKLENDQLPKVDAELAVSVLSLIFSQPSRQRCSCATRNNFPSSVPCVTCCCRLVSY